MQKPLSTDAAVGQICAAIERSDWDAVSDVWQRAPSKIRQSEPMLVAYVAGLIKQGRGASAGPLIEGFLRKQWSDQLVYQYGLLDLDDKQAQLATAEKWFEKQ